MDDLIEEFLTESSENLSQIDTDLVSLEQNPESPELLSGIFRAIHTIKGTCGFIGLDRLEKVAHAGENVLGKVRDGEIEVTPPVVTLILECLDQIKSIIATLEATGHEPEGDDSALIMRLNDLAEKKIITGAAASSAPAKQGAVNTPAPVAEELAQIIGEQETLAEEEEETEVLSDAPQAGTKKEKAVNENAGKATDAGISSQTIRVNVNLLENLMTMVSELVLTRNQLMQMVRETENNELSVPLQRLNYVTSELQENVMKTRMQPIGNAWSKIPRLVRDLAQDLNKKIELDMVGAETELDRQVIEIIKDPLTHMIRNSADHGIETPAERIKAGKKETALISLNAYHAGGHIIIEISDDGRGLPIEKIKEKAVANGLASHDAVESMTENQIYQFIFRAGFSTAQQITNVSGRGVGMDVVRSNIEKIGGNIEVNSVKGKGTTFTIKIPLTLAIISALIVEAAREQFAMPQLSVVELVRASKDSEHSIEYIEDYPVLRLRNKLLPLIPLAELLQMKPQPRLTLVANDTTAEGEDSSSVAHKLQDIQSISGEYIIVTQVGSSVFGIIVDQVYDTQEIVVKPVSRLLRQMTMFAGNTILGDGSVVMILDPNGIATAVGDIKSESKEEETMSREEEVKAAASTVSFLLFSAGDGTPKAVPLALVARLEEIDMKSVEYSGGRPVLQYRNQLMPLVAASSAINFTPEGRKPLLVFTDNGRFMGLVVEEIIDIVEENMSLKLKSDAMGSLGSTVIVGNATDIIDVDFYLRQAYPDWYKMTQEKKSGSIEILFVEDSLFFRNLIMPVLHMEGYSVTSVTNPVEALALINAGKTFDAVLTDIEMPEMNGFDFAQALRQKEGWKKIPIVALSSHDEPADYARGQQVGFTEYLRKLDRTTLIDTLNQLFKDKETVAA